VERRGVELRSDFAGKGSKQESVVPYHKFDLDNLIRAVLKKGWILIW